MEETLHSLSSTRLQNNYPDSTDVHQGCDEMTNGQAWCEERNGNQVVYDETYEQNEDLVPWNQNRFKHWGLEQWGMYTSPEKSYGVEICPED